MRVCVCKHSHLESIWKVGDSSQSRNISAKSKTSVNTKAKRKRLCSEGSLGGDETSMPVGPGCSHTASELELQDPQKPTSPLPCFPPGPALGSVKSKGPASASEVGTPAVDGRGAWSFIGSRKTW